MAYKFRNLRANEIECRIAMVRENGVSLLLYKDARCDQNILDETVGCMNWQKHYDLIDGQLFCTLEIWDEQKKMWISKQDVGVESNTEAEKGRASDAQKRAAFAFGIGRELYTAPFIWITPDKCNIKGNKCYDKFYVKNIDTVDGTIRALTIVNANKKAVVFEYGNVEKAEEKKLNEEMVKKAEAKPLSGTKIKVIRDTIARKGLHVNSVLQYYKKERFEDMTITEWNNCMQMLERYEDKK